MPDAPNPRRCKYCGSEPHHEWDDEDYKIECSFSHACKAWPRIYSNIRKHAIEIWNAAMREENK